MPNTQYLTNDGRPTPNTQNQAPPFPWRAYVAIAVVAALLWWSAKDIGFSFAAILEGFPDMQTFFTRLSPTVRPWPLDYLPLITDKMLETLKVAIAASFFGAILALPFALIGARNLAAGRVVYNIGRGFLNLLRTVPDLVLASLLVSAFGIGPFPGMLALVVFTFGVVAKLLCDTVETVDPGPMEAITAAGGNRLQRAVFAVFPQVAPDFVAYTLYSLEVNVRAAAVLGLVGAGGIGVILNRDVKFLRYDRVGLIIFAVFLVVLAIDMLSTYLRRKLV